MKHTSHKHTNTRTRMCPRLEVFHYPFHRLNSNSQYTKDDPRYHYEPLGCRQNYHKMCNPRNVLHAVLKCLLLVFLSRHGCRISNMYIGSAPDSPPLLTDHPGSVRDGVISGVDGPLLTYASGCEKTYSTTRHHRPWLGEGVSASRSNCQRVMILWIYRKDA